MDTIEEAEDYTESTYSEEDIAVVEEEIRRLSQEARASRLPYGHDVKTVNGFNLYLVDFNIDFISSDYLDDIENGRPYNENAITLGRAGWVAATASTRFKGNVRRHYQRLARLAGLTLRAMEMRQRNDRVLQTAKEKELARIERKERQRPSPWGDTICPGCGGFKRTWADSSRWACSRCGLPLGPYPAALAALTQDE